MLYYFILFNILPVFLLFYFEQLIPEHLQAELGLGGLQG